MKLVHKFENLESKLYFTKVLWSLRINSSLFFALRAWAQKLEIRWQIRMYCA